MQNIKLSDDELFNGAETVLIIQALKHFEKSHRQEIEEMEKEGKRPFFGKEYVKIITNHGLLWKLRNFVPKAVLDEHKELKDGKL